MNFSIGRRFTLLIVLAALPMTLVDCGGSGAGNPPPQKAADTPSYATPAAITYGAALSSTQLDATCPVTASTITYNQTAGAVLNAGAQTLTATCTPNDTADYYAASASVTLTVNPAVPTILTLPTASAITVGQTLASSTLTGGTASVPGAFAWTTSSTVPAVGTNSESATFTPTDAIDYMSVIGSVPVVVNPATPQITNFTLGGGSYATMDQFSNTYLLFVVTGEGFVYGDTFSLIYSNADSIYGYGNFYLSSSTSTTISGYINFNGSDSNPQSIAVTDAHVGGQNGNQYAAAFLGIGNQSTLVISPTTGTAFQIEQSTGQVDTRTTGGNTGAFFATCTSLICEQSAVQIAVDDVTGNVAYLHTGKNNTGSVPYISVYTPTGTAVCSVTATGMSYVSGIAAKGGYMVFTDSTENLVGIAKMDCTGYKTVSVAGQPWAVAMSTYGSDLVADVFSRDDAGNGVPRLTKISVPSGTTEGFVDLLDVPKVTFIRGTTPYEGIYQVQAFSLTSTAAVLFMSDSTDGKVLTINTNTSSGAKMAITHTVSVPEFPIGIAAQESASSSAVWVNYFLGTGEEVTHIGAIDPTTGNYTSGIGACATGLIGGFAADVNGVHCAGGSTIAAPLVLQP